MDENANKKAFVKFILIMVILITSGYLVVFQAAILRVNNKNTNLKEVTQNLEENEIVKSEAVTSDGSVTLDQLEPQVISSLNSIENDGGNLDIVAGKNIIVASNDIENTVKISVNSVGLDLDMMDGYYMNQGVLSTSSPTFDGITLTGNLILGSNTLTTTNSNVVKKLNADRIDGYHASSFEKTLSSGSTSQYFRGDKTWRTLNASAIAGLGSLATLDVINNSNWSGTQLAVASGGTGTTTGSITGTGALTFTSGGANQDITLTPSGTGNIVPTGNIFFPNDSDYTISVDITSGITSGRDLTIAGGSMFGSTAGHLYLMGGSVNSLAGAPGNVYVYGGFNPDPAYGDIILAYDGTTVKGNVGVGTDYPEQRLEVNGGIMLNTITAKPGCSSGNRGTFWVTQGAGGVQDDVEVCAKDAGDVYAWRTIY